ncbi:MAG: insulinase family protein [Muribaculum sp.]|nr:insulinase family protein [Muribaculaceae bacterium]MCM1080169.1 insulinase family protein [Muribaculum sp.]
MNVKSLFQNLAAAMLLAVASQAVAQMPEMPPIPIDSAVRIGKLDNGLTYYIRHNAYPEGLADYFIAQKVGSVLEEDNQRGLAHFLEHMCFNGTKNFPDSTLLNWAESVGVKFGQNLNAYTSTDETVYYLSKVPVEREGVQDSCLLILHDWADALTLDPKEIDKERGVIHEEWRSRNVGMQRINESIFPMLYPGSRYAYRLPIGTMEVVDNFPYQDLRDYYEKWYRPDLQGIVVVGDIDPDRIERQIKAIFSDIKLDPNRAEREYFPVPDTEGTIFAIGKDKEISQARIEITNKIPATPDQEKNSIMYLLDKYAMEMITSMLNARLSDMMTNPETPFAAAGSYSGNYMVSKTMDALSIVGIGKGNTIEPTFESIYREMLRASQGFTQSEYDRARNEYLSQLESAYNGRSTQTSSSLGFEYVRNFLDNEPIPGIENEYELMTFLAQDFPLEQINALLPYIWQNNNRVVVAYLPDKEGYEIPTQESLLKVIERVEAENIEPYVDSVKAEPLIPELPAPGKIVNETYDSLYQASVWTLSNGARVVVKPTDFDENEIKMYAIAKGGTSVISDSDSANLIYLPVALSIAGLGDYTSADLDKYMAGKQASVSLALSDNERAIIGSTVVKDLPVMMELLYMNLTSITISEKDFNAGKEIYRGLIHNQEATPTYHFQQALQRNLYKSPRQRMMTEQVIDNADLGRILAIVHSQMAPVQDFTFVFVGKIDVEQLRTLVEQYIASIPQGKSNSGIVKEIASVVPGSLTDINTYKMDTPQTYAAIILTGNADYNAPNTLAASFAGQILTARLLKKIREDMGATYSIYAGGSVDPFLDQNAMLQTSFPMKPEMKNAVLEEINLQINDLAENITPDEFDKVKTYMIKSDKEKKNKNDSWAYAIASKQSTGEDTFVAATKLIETITPADVKAFMKNLIDQNNYKVILLEPEQ